MSGSRCCFWHSPATTRAARAARRRGGKARMLALRPVLELVPAAPAIERAPAKEPPPWWPMRTQGQVLAAVRDVGRAVLTRKLDPRSANAALLSAQVLLAEKRSKRTWAHQQLKDRLEQLVEEVGAVAAHAPEGTALRQELERLENFVEYIVRIARRVVP